MLDGQCLCKPCAGLCIMHTLIHWNHQIGLATFGCGIIFFSMELMSSAFGFMRSHEGFIDLLTKMDNPLLGILVSTAVTGLIQSSGATMSILLSLAGQGMLTIPSACGLMLGANIGENLLPTPQSPVRIAQHTPPSAAWAVANFHMMLSWHFLARVYG